MAPKRAKLNLRKSSEPKQETDLSSLFKTDDAVEKATGMQLVAIKISAIKPDKDQPRTIFHDESLQNLSESILQDGLIQPIEVVQVGKNEYRIIHGERRWRASKLAGLTSIPAIVRRTEYDQITKFVRQIVENIQREDLNDIDRAAGLVRLRELMQAELNTEAEKSGAKPWSTKATWSKVADRLGYSRQRVSQIINLLKLPEELQESVRLGRISERETRIYQGLTAEQQTELHDLHILKNRLSSEKAVQISALLKKDPLYKVEDAVAYIRNMELSTTVDKSPSTKEVKSQEMKYIQQIEKGIALLGRDPDKSAHYVAHLHELQHQLTELIQEIERNRFTP